VQLLLRSAAAFNPAFPACSALVHSRRRDLQLEHQVECGVLRARLRDRASNAPPVTIAIVDSPCIECLSVFLAAPSVDLGLRSGSKGEETASVSVALDELNEREWFEQ
jgi:hypothetical protein